MTLSPGMKLRLLRAERGLTLVEAAAKTGVDRGTLSSLERGVHTPYTPTLAKIARGYDVSVEELLPEPYSLAEPTLDEVARLKRREEKLDEAIREMLDVATGWTMPMPPGERLSVIEKIGLDALQESSERRPESPERTGEGLGND